MKIVCVVGARPNFMKSAPLLKELAKYPEVFEVVFVHTGQHYDDELSKLFFDDLKLPVPNIYLGVGSASHAQQTANIMIETEKVLLSEKPDLIVVFGDINSTMAAAIVAVKLNIKVAHVEAGLRSFDNTMPEEINRIVTDRLSDYLFVSEPSGLTNLRREGVSKEKIIFVGNIMIDTLINNLKVAQSSNILNQLDLVPKKYIVLTMHRPSNVDNKEILSRLLDQISSICLEYPVIFPCHPRTRKNLEKFGLENYLNDKTIKIINPLGYLDFLKLQSNAFFVMTDSGGIQEETTYLKIPCITLRENTERPITVEIGSNIITGIDFEKIRKAVHQILNYKNKKSKIPKLWDGKAASRIVNALLKYI